MLMREIKFLIHVGDCSTESRLPSSNSALKVGFLLKNDGISLAALCVVAVFSSGGIRNDCLAVVWEGCLSEIPGLALLTSAFAPSFDIREQIISAMKLLTSCSVLIFQ